MTKKIIRVGDTANDKKGDSLRSAFIKVNENFTELYTALGLDTGDLNLGAFEFSGSTMSTTDSTPIVIDQATTVTSDLTVGGDIIPSIANGGNLGSLDKPFRSLYVSNNTVYIGGTAVGINSNGQLTVDGSTVSGGGSTAWADITGKPTIPTLTSQLTNDSGFLTSVGTISYNDLSNKPTIPSLGNFAFSGSTAYSPTGTNLWIDPENLRNTMLQIPGPGNETAFPLTLKSIGNVIINSNNNPFTFNTTGGLTFPDATVQTTAWDTGYLSFDDAALRGTSGYQYTFNTDGYFSGSTSSESTNYFFVTYNSTNLNIAAGWTVVGANCDTTVSSTVYPVGGYPGVIRVNLTAAASSTSGFYPVVVTSPDRLKVQIQPNPGTASKYTFTTAGLTFPDATVQTTAYTGPQTSLDGDVTGSVFADDSTLLVDGVSGIVPNSELAKSITQVIDSNATVNTSATVTTNNSYTNTVDFSTDVDPGVGYAIAGWYQRNSEQIEFALFGPGSFQTYLTGLALGRTVIVTYSTGSGNQTLTRTLTQRFSATGQSDPANPTWGRVSGRIDATLPADQTGIVSINFPVYSTSNNTWTFSAGGSLTFPDSTAQTTAWTGVANIARNIESENDVSIKVNLTDSTQRIWQFGEDGDLILPAGGDIKNSTGTSVLGGSVSSLVNGAYTASLGNTGALTLPAGGIISEGGGLTGAIKLRPAGGFNANQALLIYPTAGGDGDHIHLTAGGGSTELYLGDDSRYVKLVNGGDIAVLANNGAVNRVFNWVGQGGWNQASYTAVATTGGTGTGLTVNVAAGGAGYININLITINNPGTGYTVGDVITINNENNLPGTFQIGVAANNWTFGTDGSLASNEFKIKTLDGIPNSINTPSITDTQYWDLNYGSNLATTGGTGTGLFVNVSDGGSGYASISINAAGTGYSPGDIITVTNGPFNGAPYASSATFIIGVSGTRSWTFDRYGALTLPSGNGSSVIQSVQQNGYQSKVTVSPFQILSQARRNQSQSFETAEGDFTSAASDGNGMITFVGLQSGVAEFLIDTMENGGVYERTVRLNGTGPEYGYSSFNDTNDELFLVTAAPAGAVTEIRFSYTRISKIDICPDEGVFRIESEPTQDIDIQSGEEFRLTATDRVDIDTGTNMRLRAGDGSVQITTNFQVPGATTHQWEFTNGGRLLFPNNTTLKDTVGNAIAFGYEAGLNSQGAAAIAIGTEAGYTSQGANAVAVGAYAGGGEQGANSIAIGYSAGYNGQAANSIVINATGSVLNQATANTFTVAPIRNISATSGVLQYNSSTKEVSYSNSVTAETFNTDQITIVGNRISTTVTNANLELECNGSGGVVINTLAEATTASTARSAGYLGIPASAVSTTNTLTIADAGEHIYVTTNSQTITIPANASVAYPIGTTLTFIAGPSATTVTIAITSDTMYLAGTGTTGTRTLAAHGMATAVKVAATTWYINGTGLT